MQDGPRLSKLADDPPGDKAVRVCAPDSSKQLRPEPPSFSKLRFPNCGPSRVLLITL